MGAVLVHIDLDGDRIVASSLAALSAGRAVASSWGATLYAALIVHDPSAKQSVPKLDGVQTALARAGADKIVVAFSDVPVVSLWCVIGGGMIIASSRARALRFLCLILALSLVIAAAGMRIYLIYGNFRTLDIWDERLVQLGSELIDQRVALVRELAAPLAEAYRSIVDADHAPELRPLLSIDGADPEGDSPADAASRTRSDEAMDAAPSSSTTAMRFAETIRVLRPKELERGITRLRVRRHVARGERHHPARRSEVVAVPLDRVRVGVVLVAGLHDVEDRGAGVADVRVVGVRQVAAGPADSHGARRRIRDHRGGTSHRRAETKGGPDHFQRLPYWRGSFTCHGTRRSLSGNDGREVNICRYDGDLSVYEAGVLPELSAGVAAGGDKGLNE